MLTPCWGFSSRFGQRVPQILPQVKKHLIKQFACNASSVFWSSDFSRNYLKSHNYTTTINNYKDFLPLLTVDHDGDVGEHDGVYHEHDQDRTWHRGDRTFIFHILIITTEQPNKLVQLAIEETPIAAIKVKMSSVIHDTTHPPTITNTFLIAV